MGVIGFLVARQIPSDQTTLSPETTLPSNPVVARGDLAQDEQTTIELFRRNAPCVVHITTKQAENNFLTATITEGSGTGFVWDKSGHIVTNNHVVDDAYQAHVVLADASVWAARLVGRAPSKDLAVLKIDAPSDTLTPILVGTSKDLAVGQKVFAIGNPFGLDRTLTTGVISALDRQIESVQTDQGAETNRTIDGVIQTDAAINPGNSGGPILDSAGRLIGVSTSIYSPSGANAGVGFAIPVDTVNRFIPQLIEHGRIIRPSIGVQLANDSVLRGYGDETNKGVLIWHTMRNSPADLAGLRPTRVTVGRRGVSYVQFGDVIIKADETDINDLNDWYSFLESKQTGEQVNLTVVRGLFSESETQLVVQVPLGNPE
jgi:S1-C subfamily serine protease